MITAASIAVLVLAAAPAFAVPASADPMTSSVVGWGRNVEMQTAVPENVPSSGITSISAGGYHSLALDADGHVYAWGDDTDAVATVPEVVATERVSAISAGAYHSLALTDTGEVLAWGTNDDGQADVPADVHDATAIAAGGFHSLVLVAGRVVAFGADDSGASTVPDLDEPVTAIAAGYQHSLALTATGRVVAWGANDSGQCNVPTELADETVVGIAAGRYFSLAVTSSGRIVGWGDSFSGQLDVPSDLDAAAVDQLVQLNAGGYHVVALLADGRIIAWGEDQDDQVSLPADPSEARAIAVAAGMFHSLALYEASPQWLTISNPRDVTVTPGSRATFTVVADGVPEPSVHWQRWNDADASWLDVAGANDVEYSFTTAAADDGALFRAVATSSFGTRASLSALLRIDVAAPSSGSSPPGGGGGGLGPTGVTLVALAIAACLLAGGIAVVRYRRHGNS